MAKKRAIILHIGFPKTGTTSLQAGLGRNRKSLIENGICYPECVGPANQYHLEAYACAFGDKASTHTMLKIRSAEDLEDFRQRTEEALVAEVSALPDSVETLLFSNEGLAGLTKPEEFDRLLNLLAKVGEVKQIIAYIRRQDLNGASNYTTYLKTGGTRKQILLKYPPDTPAYIFYGRKLRLWADRFGEERISVRFFDRSEMLQGDLFDDFRAVAGIPLAVDFRVTERTNPSISPAACAFLRAFNERFPRFVDGERNPARRGVREALEEHFPGKGKRPTRAEVADYMVQFEESNEYIRQTWFPNRDVLFDDDYSAYPEEEEIPTVDEIMEVFNTVWEARHKSR